MPTNDQVRNKTHPIQQNYRNSHEVYQPHLIPREKFHLFVDLVDYHEGEENNLDGSDYAPHRRNENGKEVAEDHRRDHDCQKEKEVEKYLVGEADNAEQVGALLLFYPHLALLFGLVTVDQQLVKLERVHEQELAFDQQHDDHGQREQDDPHQHLVILFSKLIAAVYEQKRQLHIFIVVGKTVVTHEHRGEVYENQDQRRPVDDFLHLLLGHVFHVVVDGDDGVLVGE